MQKIAFFGMGVMGSRMTRHLIDAGHHVTVWNRTAEKCEPLREAGAAVAATPAEAAREASVLMWCVSDDSAVEELLWGAQGLLEGVRQGQLAIDLSTISPAMSRREHDALSERGLHMLDAPVIGSRPQAEQGTLLVVAGGDPQVVDKARPLLDSFAKAVHRMGGPTKGASAKLAGNLVLAFQVQAQAESMLLAKRSGVDIEKMAQVLGEAGYGSPFLGLLAQLSLDRKWDVNFALKHLLKDSNLIGDEARNLNLPLPGSAAVRQTLRAAVNQGWGDENIHAAVKALEWMAGTRLDR